MPATKAVGSQVVLHTSEHGLGHTGRLSVFGAGVESCAYQSGVMVHDHQSYPLCRFE